MEACVHFPLSVLLAPSSMEGLEEDVAAVLPRFPIMAMHLSVIELWSPVTCLELLVQSYGGGGSGDVCSYVSWSAHILAAAIICLGCFQIGNSV